MKKPLEFLLAFVAALPSIFAVLFTPSLPILAEHFQVTFGETQQTMVFYLAGYALGQLPYGPLSNKFGRKPVFYLGMLLAILSSIGVIISGMVHSFPLFIISRFCMACGACVGLNVAYTIVGDLYDENKALKVLSFIMLLSAIIPGLATFTGGFLTQNFGWQGCFVFLGIFGLLMIALVYKFLPETTRQKDPNAIQIHQIFKAYWSEIHNKKLWSLYDLSFCFDCSLYRN
jgi:MFS family permease